MSLTFLAIGECMLELIPNTDETLTKSYAGDTYNALVYAKRLFPSIDARLFSAVGQDEMSRSMIGRLQSEGINTACIQRSAEQTIGIYSISVDAEGERSFSYWRKDSAATKMMRLRSESQLLALCDGADLVFFSGISLGILNEIDKAKLLQLLAKLRKQGATIAFDPNYRPKMFKHKDDAKEWFRKAYQVSDIALPGLDEHQDLFAHHDASQVNQYCRALGVSEVVVKAGVAGCFAYTEQDNYHLAFSPAPKQIDTTAAGDSFAGVYLSSRLNGASIENAVKNAANVAKIVVQHRGAIIPSKLLLECQKQLIC